jgi:hypothetical protein
LGPLGAREWYEVVGFTRSPRWVRNPEQVEGRRDKVSVHLHTLAAAVASFAQAADGLLLLFR